MQDVFYLDINQINYSESFNIRELPTDINKLHSLKFELNHDDNLKIMNAITSCSW